MCPGTCVTKGMSTFHSFFGAREGLGSGKPRLPFMCKVLVCTLYYENVYVCMNECVLVLKLLK